MSFTFRFHTFLLINEVLHSFLFSDVLPKDIPSGSIKYDSTGYKVMKKRKGQPHKKSWAPTKAKHRQLMKTYLLIEGVSL